MILPNIRYFQSWMGQHVTMLIYCHWMYMGYLIGNWMAIYLDLIPKSVISYCCKTHGQLKVTNISWTVMCSITLHGNIATNCLCATQVEGVFYQLKNVESVTIIKHHEDCLVWLKLDEKVIRTYEEKYGGCMLFFKFLIGPLSINLNQTI